MQVHRHTIKDEDKRRFWEDGYWISPKLIDDEQIARLRTAHERIWAHDFDGDGYPMSPSRTSDDPFKLRKHDNAWWINDEVQSIVTSPYIGELAADLLEIDSVRLWHDQVIYKPGTSGKETKAGNVGWHQDYGYWQCAGTTNMITVWIALQDTDLTNGGMMTILGSHKWGVVEESDTFFDPDLEALKQKFDGKGQPWIEEPCILKAGQASFHHALTFHGSSVNLTDQPRLSVVAHLMPGDTPYRARISNHDNIKLLGPRPRDGQLFDNAYFPLLFERGVIQ
ncbi:MAG: phytanoyl-CoA dioxygenase family protein [Paenibacillus sp.]|jgi:ectoine hydroxylase-related dioxygenase (phytanoyl-CoA dioxygenase family)|nr:phytanoyl-CoA dioxygenase family protein [Paenibacillus sp.]